MHKAYFKSNMYFHYKFYKNFKNNSQKNFLILNYISIIHEHESIINKN